VQFAGFVRLWEVDSSVTYDSSNDDFSRGINYKMCHSRLLALLAIVIMMRTIFALFLCCWEAASFAVDHSASSPPPPPPPPPPHPDCAKRIGKNLAMPAPMPFDGHVVDLVPLKDLLDSGALIVIERRKDYSERRTDGYVEPEMIYLLGTSHVSETSAEHVRRVAQAVKPQSVVVELCRGRLGLLAEPATAQPTREDGQQRGSSVRNNPLGLSGASLAESLERSFRMGGATASGLRILLAKVVSQQERPVAFGVDFRAAAKAAEEMEAALVLGDRPIEITLKRAWGALSRKEKIKVVGGLLFAALLPPKQTAESRDLMGRVAADGGALGDDVVEDLMQKLANEIPSIVAPLLHERDAYYAWTVKRSMAVQGNRRVLGVLGRGHLRGVATALQCDNGGDSLIFKDLTYVEKEDDTVASKVLFGVRVIGETLGPIALWKAYESGSFTLPSLFS
jgi:pheromone shutdown protein TraB